MPHRWAFECVSHCVPGLTHSQVSPWCAQAGALVCRWACTWVGVSAPFCLLLHCSLTLSPWPTPFHSFFKT